MKSHYFLLVLTFCMSSSIFAASNTQEIDVDKCWSLTNTAPEGLRLEKLPTKICIEEIVAKMESGSRAGHKADLHGSLEINNEIVKLEILDQELLPNYWVDYEFNGYRYYLQITKGTNSGSNNPYLNTDVKLYIYLDILPKNYVGDILAEKSIYLSASVITADRNLILWNPEYKLTE